MEDVNEVHALQVNPIRTDITTGVPFYYSVIFESTKITDNYSRRYVKIQDFIANIGGLIKFLLTFSSIIMSIFSQDYLCIELGEHLFSFSKEIPKRHSQMNVNSFPSFVNEQLKKSTNVKEAVYSNLNIKVINSSEMPKQNLNFEEVRISFSDYVGSLLFCRSKNGRSTYTSLIKIINDKLEIRYLLKSCMRVDTYYKNILTEDQRKLVDDRPRLYQTKDGLCDIT
jgi:hypothetical protein